MKSPSSCIQLGPYRAEIENRKRVDTATGFTTVSDGKIVGEVLVEINMQKLIGRRAWTFLQNKSGRCTLAYGAIVFKAINRKVER